MTLSILFLFLLLVGMAFFFISEKLPVDLTAFLGLVILVVFGYVAPDEAFTGFSSPAVITMLSIFFVSGALRKTGLADIIGTRIHKVTGSREVPLMIAVMIVAGCLSAFMNNVAATAVLMPAVASLSKKAQISPARLFMPLSFATVLGGTLTMVGTPPNILGAEMLAKRGLEPFSLFDFTPMGLIILIAGILYMILVGRKLLPDAKVSEDAEMRDLARVYKLQDHLTTIQIPPSSALDGRTLREADIGALLGVQVVGIIRHGEKKLAPTGGTMLQAGDQLVVKGKAEELESMLGLTKLEISETKDSQIREAGKKVRLLCGKVSPGSQLVGQTLRSIDFRHRYHMFTVGILRRGRLILREIVGEPIEHGDQLIIATKAGVSRDSLETHGDFTLHDIDPETLEAFLACVFVLTIPDESPMVGETLGESRIGEFLGLSVVGVIRDEVIEIELSPEYRIREGDHIFVTGERNRIDALIEMGKVRFGSVVRPSEIQSEKVGVIEATLAPRSSAVGKTLSQLNFRDRYDLQVLAIWHDGRPLHKQIGHISLKTGDALLLQGSWKKINLFGSDPDFVTLSASVQEPRLWEKAPYALGALALMIVLVITGWQPVHVASFMAAVAVVLTGAITMEAAMPAAR